MLDQYHLFFSWIFLPLNTHSFFELLEILSVFPLFNLAKSIQLWEHSDTREPYNFSPCEKTWPRSNGGRRRRLPFDGERRTEGGGEEVGKAQGCKKRPSVFCGSVQPQVVWGDLLCCCALLPSHYRSNRNISSFSGISYRLCSCCWCLLKKGHVCSDIAFLCWSYI